MKKDLIIFTESYPYGNTEQFLYDEIKVISNYFNTITLIVYNPNGKLQNEKIDFNNLDYKVVELNSLHKLSIIFNIKFWLTFFKSSYLSENKIKAYSIKSFRVLLHKFSLMFSIDNLIIDQNISINKTVFYSYWYLNYASSLVYYNKFIKPINFFIRIHGYDYDKNQSDDAYFYQRDFELIQNPNIIAISSYAKKYIVDNYNNFQGEIFISKLGTKDFGIQKFTKREDLNIVSCSSIISIKRVNLIVKLLGEIDFIDVNWTHFGDGDLLNEVESYCRKLPSNINYDLKGYVENEKLKKYYQSESFDFFIHFSEIEGIPVSIMEAISFGIPVIACDVGGVNEIVNNDIGLLLNKDFENKTVLSYVKNYIGMSEEEILINRKKVRQSWVKSYNSEVVFANLVKKMNKCAE